MECLGKVREGFCLFFGFGVRCLAGLDFPDSVDLICLLARLSIYLCSSGKQVVSVQYTIRSVGVPICRVHLNVNLDAKPGVFSFFLPARKMQSAGCPQRMCVYFLNKRS